MSEKNSFVVYMDIKEVVDELDDKQVADLFRAMLEYQETGKVPKLTGSLKYIFIPIRQQMDRDAEKWDKTKAARAEAGRRGGLKSGEVRAKQNEANEANASFGSSNEANEANEAVNVNVNVNGNVNGNGNGNVSAPMADVSSLSSSLMDQLNRESGGNYRTSPSVERMVAELIESGYTETDMRRVIHTKSLEWKDDEKMRPYLRPATLFGKKFAEYAAAPISLAAEQARKAADTRDSLMRELNDKKAALAEITASIEEIPRDENGKLGPHLEEFRLLTDQKAILEDSITRLSGQLGN